VKRKVLEKNISIHTKKAKKNNYTKLGVNVTKSGILSTDSTKRKIKVDIYDQQLRISSNGLQLNSTQNKN
jgi:hypothetical protein